MNTGTFSLQNYKIYANLLLVSKKRANFATAKPKIGHAGPDGVAIINFLNNNTASFFMATKIRLQRHGRKGYAYYPIVVADSRAPRDGRFIERIGSYNPNTNPATISLDFDRALYWMEVGAQPTDTVRSILSKEGVLLMKHLRGGVKKGAFNEEEAQRRFNAWKESRDKEASAAQAKKAAQAAEEAKARFEAEAEKNRIKGEAVAKKKAEKLAAEEEAAKAALEAEVENAENQAAE